jgi:hypothetical protein
MPIGIKNPASFSREILKLMIEFRKNDHRPMEILKAFWESEEAGSAMRICILRICILMSA